MKKTLLMLVLTVFIAVNWINLASAETSISDTKSTPTPAAQFKFSNGVITQFIGNDTEVIIPSEINGIAVTEIDFIAFSYTRIMSITIPDSVTSIGDYAFDGCTELKSIIIGDGVTKIGKNVFSNCYKLSEIEIPDGVTSIGSSAFKGCTGLTSITIPDSVTDIGASAFEGCTGLTSITIPDSVTSIEYGAFRGCTGLKEITIGSNVTSIGLSAFENCTGLGKLYWNAKSVNDFTSSNTAFSNIGTSGIGVEVIFGENVKKIPKYLFYTSSGYAKPHIASVTISDSVTDIGSCAFSGCTSLVSITIPDSVTSIEDSAFSGCTSLASVTIPDSVTNIGSYVFRSCTSLVNITIPNSVTNIGSYVFSSCTSLVNITIPNSVTNIGSYAFSGCTSLASVTIPDNVTSIGAAVFSGCTGLEKVYWNAKAINDFTSSNTAFSNAGVGGTGIQVIFGENVEKIPKYLFYTSSEHTKPNITSVVISDSITSIGYNAFRECTSLTSIRIGNGLTNIDDYTFVGCTGLTSVTIGNSITSIGKGAFSDCIGLTSVTIPDSVTNIGRDAFSGCTGLEEITIGSNVIGIGLSAFEDCTGLEKVYWNAKAVEDFLFTIGGPFINAGINTAGIEFVFGDDVERIPAYLFSDQEESTNAKITSVTIGNSVTSIGIGAFANCTELTSVTIGNSVTSIDNRAFSGCTSLTSVIIPDSVTNIGDYVFEGCTGLKEITIGSNVTVIGWSAFGDCTELASVIIPNSVTGIEGYAFSGCTELKNITIGKGLTSIGVFAFKGCVGLTSVTIPNNVTSVDSGAFANCTGLEYIYWNAEIRSAADKGLFSNAGTGGSGIEVVFGDAVEHIPGALFWDSPSYVEANIISVIIPDSVTSIGGSAFRGCTGLKEITIGSNVTDIESSAFRDCTRLASVTIPNSVTSIGSYAFANCTELTSVYGTLNIRTIGESAFRNSGIIYIYLPKCEYIGATAFKNCVNLSNIELSKRIRYIGYSYNREYYNDALEGCTNLSSIKITKSTDCSNLVPKTYFDGTCDPTGVSIYGQTVGAPGDMFALEKDVYPYDAYNYITTWKSSNTAVATVDCGIITCKAIGRTTITAKTTNGLTDTITIVVTNSKLNIVDEGRFSVKPDNAYTVYATLESEDYTGAEAVWSVGNDAVAEIIDSGYTDNGDNTYTLWATVKGIYNGSTNVIVEVNEAIDSHSFRVIDENAKKTYSGNFAYRLDDDGNAIITEIRAGEETGTISIPTEIDGHKVVAIEEYCLYGDDKINKVVIPSSIERIEENALVSDNDDLTIYYMDSEGKWKEITEERQVVSDGEIVCVESRDITDYGKPESSGNSSSSGGGGDDEGKDNDLSKVTSGIGKWKTQLNKFIDLLVKRVTKIKEDNSFTDEEVIQNNYEENKPKLKKMIAESWYQTGSDAAREAAYRGLYDMLADWGEDCISLDDIQPGSGMVDFSNRIVKNVINGMKNKNFTKEYGDYTVMIDVFGMKTDANGNPAFTGNLTVRDKNGRVYGPALINSTLEETKEVMSNYMLQLKELADNTIEQAMEDCIDDLSALTGINTPLDAIKERLDNIPEAVDELLKKNGLSNLNEYVGDAIEVMKSIEGLIDIQNSDDPNAIAEAVFNLDDKLGFLTDESMTITQYATDMAYENLTSITEHLKDATEAYLEGKEIPEYESPVEKKIKKVTNWIKNCFNCPVDVYVYNENDELMACASEDQTFSNSDNILIERLDDTKTVYVTDDAKVYFKLIGTDVGILDYISETCVDGKIVGRTNYYNVELYDGKEIMTRQSEEVESNGCNEIVLETAGEVVAATELLTVKDNAAVLVETETIGNGDVQGLGWYARGDVATLVASPDEGYVFKGWYDGDIPITFDSTYTFCVKDFKKVKAKFNEYYNNNIETYQISGNIISYGDCDNVIIELIREGVAIETITTNNNMYSFEDVETGEYILRTSKSKHCTREYKVTVTDTDITQNVELWLYGDVNGDGTVNHVDVLQINRNIASQSSVFDAGADDLKAYRFKVANVTAINGSDTVLNHVDVLQINRKIANLTSVFDSLS